MVELLKNWKFEEAGVSKEDIEILKGLEFKEVFDNQTKKAPKGLEQNKLNKWIEGSMGKVSYTKYVEASKKLHYLIKREEEKEGLKEFKKGNFTEFRGYAYPVVPKIIRFNKGEKVEYSIGLVTSFNKNESIYLTSDTGYQEPRNEYQRQLIEGLKESIADQEVGAMFELNDPESHLMVTYRITVEAYKKR